MMKRNKKKQEIKTQVFQLPNPKYQIAEPKVTTWKIVGLFVINQGFA